MMKWCLQYNLKIELNDEVFFMNERILMKPDFILNNKVYVDLVDDADLSDAYSGYCEAFARSYGMLMVIPLSMVPEIETLTKKDLERRFNIRF